MAPLNHYILLLYVIYLSTTTIGDSLFATTIKPFQSIKAELITVPRTITCKINYKLRFNSLLLLFGISYLAVPLSGLKLRPLLKKYKINN